jgi:hypothetical protein
MLGLGTLAMLEIALRCVLQELNEITVVYICVQAVSFHSMSLNLYCSFHFVYGGVGGRGSDLISLPEKRHKTWNRRHLHGLNR